jgi:AcrR family transcriptional regulator
MTKLETRPPMPAGSARRGRPPKLTAEAGGDTRSLILDAAEDLFSKHGFYGVTIREVAREAGVVDRRARRGARGAARGRIFP